MMAEVVEEKRPLFRAPPPLLFTDPIEVDRERRNQVEFSAQIGQRLERDRMNYPLRSPPRALISQRLAELGDLMGKLHPIGRVAAVRLRPARIKRTTSWELTAAPLVSAAIATSATVATAAAAITAA